MADVVVSYSNIVQGVESDGKRSVEATIDFDTGDYVTGGIPIPLASLGLKTIEKAYVAASASVDKPYTEAQWITANDTVTYDYFVNLTVPETPKLLVYSAGNVLSGAVAATAQLRLKLIGT